MLKLVSVGETTADHYPKLDQTLVGGISLNFAVQAKRCGVPMVSMVSAVGDDEHGKMILAKLKQENIDTSHLTIMAGQTAYCEIVVLDNGERYFPPNSYHQHVLASYKPSAADLNFVQQHDIVVSRFDISYTKETFNAVIRDLQFAGKKVVDFGDWFDYKERHPEIYPYLDYIDLAFISGDQTTIETFRPLADRFPTQFVITLGEKGSIAFENGNVLFQKALEVPKLVDTTGCGDSFQAAFTAAYFQASSVQASLAAGAQQAAKTIQHFGAI